MILLLPLLGVRVEDVLVLLLLTEAIKVGTEDFLAVALGGERLDVVGVDGVVLLEGSLEVGTDGRSDVRGTGREDGVLGGSCWAEGGQGDKRETMGGGG